MATDLQTREYSRPAPVKEIDSFVAYMQSEGLELKLVSNKVSFDFLICNSCFWCASTLGEYDTLHVLLARMINSSLFQSRKDNMRLIIMVANLDLSEALKMNPC